MKPNSKNKTLKDLVDFAKANPGQATYMASGIGTGGHIAAEEMAVNAGVKFNHLPSKTKVKGCCRPLRTGSRRNGLWCAER